MAEKQSINDQLRVNNTSHARSGGFVVTKAYQRKLILGRLFEILLMAIIVAIVVFIGWTTINGPVRTANGYIYPSSSAIPNIGSKVIVSEQADNFAGRLYNGVKTQTPVYGKVIVGNYGTLTPTGDLYTVVQDSKIFATRVKVDSKHGKYLNNEYIIRYTNGKNKGKEQIVKGDFVRVMDKK